MWDFMISSHYLITNYISWEVHSDEDVLFWWDSWNGHIPLICEATFLDIHERVSEISGSHSIDYVDFVEINFGRVH